MILSKSSFGNTSIASFCHCCYAVKYCNAVRKISFDIVEKVHVYWNDICLKIGTLVTKIILLQFFHQSCFASSFVCYLEVQVNYLLFFRSCEVEI